MTDQHAIEHDEVMAYLDGELSPARAESVRAHLEHCDACRALADDLRHVSTRLQGWEVDAAPATLPTAVSDALDRRGADGGSRWSWLVVPGVLGLPRWSLAAGSLAAVALVAVIARPSSDPALESIGDLAENFATEGPTLESAAPVPVRVPQAADADASDLEQQRDLLEMEKTTINTALAERLDEQPRSRQTTVPTEASARATQPPRRATTPPADARASATPPPAAVGRAAAAATPPAVARPTRPPAPPVGQARTAAVAERRNADATANAAVGGVAGGMRLEMADQAAASPPEPPVAERARLTLATSDLDQTRESLVELARRLDGRIEVQTMTGDGADRVLSATVRVPVDQLEVALDGLRAMGTILEDARDADDVAEESQAVSSRLQRAVEEEQQLAVRVGAPPTDAREVATLKRELTSMRQSIDALRNEEADLIDRREFAVITLTVRIERSRPDDLFGLEQVISPGKWANTARPLLLHFWQGARHGG